MVEHQEVGAAAYHQGRRAWDGRHDENVVMMLSSGGHAVLIDIALF